MPAPFVPTPEQARLVEALAGYGIPAKDICALIVSEHSRKPIDEKTLRKHFRAELDGGEVKANAKVAGSLYKNAVENNNVAAQIFWLKSRAGWKETIVNENVGKDGGPITSRIDVRFIAPEDDGEVG